MPTFAYSGKKHPHELRFFIRCVLSEPEGWQNSDEDGFGPGSGGSRELPVGGAGARHGAARRQSEHSDVHHGVRRLQHHRPRRRPRGTCVCGGVCVSPT